MKPEYLFNDKNEFIIEHYDKAKTFASFLPGIAGIDGIPMWAFYVNRGQVLGSFGVRDRDGTIMEFFPAHTMYQNVERKGFRTFIKLDGEIHEIFSSISRDQYNRKLVIEKNSVRIVEENLTLGLRIAVTYFTMPGESYAAIVRKVCMESLDGTDREIEVLDGMPQLLPVGATNAGYQEMANLMKSWYEVYNTENRIAYYKVRASTADTVEVSEFEEGNFYLSFSSESHGLLPPIYDMDIIFGYNNALSKPDGWDCSIEELLSRKQIAQNKVSGGFTGVKATVNKVFTLCTVIGHVSGMAMINARKNDFSLEFIERKERQAAQLVENLVGDTYTKTAVSLFDKYIDQCYLDNLLRGGYPLVFKAGSRNHVYHVFSRKHGDLEREYNFFSLEPALYSQGNGNFRDVSQNRRNDVLVKPEVRDFNVRHFMNLIQADGYNPLSVKGCTFTLNEGDWSGIEELIGTHRSEIKKLVTGKYTPGKLITFIIEHNTQLAVSKEELLEKVLEKSCQNLEAEFGEGYWSDHWTYNMDLVETFLTVYPDMKESFLFDEKAYCFYKSPVFVLPRSDKYVLANGRVRQYGALLEEKENPHEGAEGCWLRTGQGAGEVYYTSLYVKLLALALIKFVSLDPEGMGVEIEAGKPGWNDALNGLSGLFGSSMCETAELLRIVDFIIACSKEYHKKISLPEEINTLMNAADSLLEENLAAGLNEFEYWDQTAAAKERYRSQIRRGIAGKEVEADTGDLLKIFSRFRAKLQRGMDKSLTFGDGIYPTYFTYKAVRYEMAEGKKSPVNGQPNVTVSEFECCPLPLFLEGPARILRTVGDEEKALELYNTIRSSDIFDTKLEMYKTSVSLEESSTEIGRLRAFTPGWLEREAVFLHMEYKYLYAMLQAGLYRQFFEDIRTMLVPFMKPEVYGRSTLENSSFIASSANPDESVHGRGFVARMSGSTAEMLSMWFLMMAGREVFTCKNGELRLALRPVLPGWMFDAVGRVSFKFLGSVIVNYINPGRKNTYGEDSVKPEKYVLTYMDKTEREIAGEIIEGREARDIRNKKVDSIDVHLK